MVRDHRVDKIAFTGSTAAGRKIGAICGERVARCTLELGRQVGGRDPRRRGYERRGSDIGRRGMLPVRTGVRLTDPNRGAAPAPRRVRRCACRRVLRGTGRRPVRRRHAHGAAGDAAPARPSGALHRQGHRGRCDAGDRRRQAQTPEARLLHRADCIRGSGQQTCHRAGGDLRAGAKRDPGRQRRTCGRYRQRHHLRTQRGGLHAGCSPGAERSPDDCARAPSGTTV